MTLDDRLSRALAAHAPKTIRMFGGTCYMARGHMALGTYKGGLMARVAAADHAAMLAHEGARELEMRGRVMEGFMLIDADAVEGERELAAWVRRALDYNRTLPLRAEKPRGKSTARKVAARKPAKR